MKTFFLLFSFFYLSQTVKAQLAPAGNIKPLVICESGQYPKEPQLTTSCAVKKFYNIHIVRDFPTLTAVTVETMAGKDDSNALEPELTSSASVPVSKNKAPLKNITWSNKNKK